MNKRTGRKLHGFVLAAIVTVCFGAVLFVGQRHNAKAGTETTGRASAGERLSNYDIREDDSASAFIAAARGAGNREADDIAIIREGFVRGEVRLRTAVPSVKIEYNNDLRIPEVIGTNAWARSIVPLSRPTSAGPDEVLRRFIKDNSELFGVSRGGADALIERASDRNAKGQPALARLEQQIGGVPVFRGEVKAWLSADRQIIRIVNNLAPGLEDDRLPADFCDPLDAVNAAAGHIGYDIAGVEPAQQKTRGNTTAFGSGDWATTAEKMYFPTEPGVAVAAWRVLIWLPETAYYVIVDAATGTMLWRKNLSDEQTASATYNVYGNLTSLVQSADSPAPFSPGCIDPANCPQPTAVARTNFTLIGNEAPNTFNDTGWIPDTGLPVRTPANPNITDGNNVEAGIDRDGMNGVDPLGHAVGNPTRVFNSTYNPAPGLPPPGDSPTPPNPQTYPPTPLQQGVTAHGFYLVNRWHDEMYKLGFNEQAGNFQHFNFGRGGTEGDRISLEVQDSTGTNGANFVTAADGTRGRMQGFLWTPSTPDRDGTLDSTVVLHEMTHGVSNRLHGNATGLNSNMARGLAEGWSDFYAAALLSEPTDAACGTHALGGYISHEITAGYANHYYGLRRFPIAKLSCVGGPSSLPYNPLTFAHLNAGNCAAFASAYPRGPLGVAQCDQVHNAGEVWAAALWEMRGVLIDRFGAVDGNRRSLRYTTDAMKLSALNPTFLQARDSVIIAAMIADGVTAANAVQEGFRRRGLGHSATIQNQSPASVTQAFDLSPSQIGRPFDFDGDGSTDISVYRPSEGNWYLQRSSSGAAVLHWGNATDKLVPADYDGDDKTDVAVFRKGENSTWYILNSATNTVRSLQFGATNLEQAIIFDTPVPADYDGDGRADPAHWRLTDNLGEPARFLIQQSGSNQLRIQQWGLTGDTPVPADYDGDNRTDFAIYRSAAPGGGQWWIQNSLGLNVRVLQFGSAADKPVAGDYTGDGVADIAVWRPATGEWYVLRSENNSFFAFPFGVSTDVPVPGDYDGDGKIDAGVFRPSNSNWYINRSNSGILIQQFGTTGDMAVPNAFVR